MSSVPPSPVVVEKTCCHVELFVDVSTRYARPYAVSHVRRTLLSRLVAPRSTLIDCGSLNALPHRVPELPSTALAPTCDVPGSTLDTVTGRPRASSTSTG